MIKVVLSKSERKAIRIKGLNSNKQVLFHAFDRCIPISPNQCFWVKVSHAVYTELVFGGEMGMKHLITRIT